MLKPRIGIRPVIDGRWGGVRESLENKTMSMAKAAADLISSTLRYQDGTPVECRCSNGCPARGKSCRWSSPTAAAWDCGRCSPAPRRALIPHRN